MAKQEIAEDIMNSRQAWFWRRVTLQAVLTVLCAMLAYSVLVTASLRNDWTTVTVQLGLIGAVVFLVTIYFAAVNDANKIANFVGAVGHAVGDIRDGVPTPARPLNTANIAG